MCFYADQTIKIIVLIYIAVIFNYFFISDYLSGDFGSDFKTFQCRSRNSHSNPIFARVVNRWLYCNNWYIGYRSLHTTWRRSRHLSRVGEFHSCIMNRTRGESVTYLWILRSQQSAFYCNRAVHVCWSLDALDAAALKFIHLRRLRIYT